MNTNLCIDIGNSATKCGLFRGEKLVRSYHFDGVFDEYIFRNCFSLYPVAKVMLCSVKPVNRDFKKYLKTNHQVIEMSHKLRLPVKIKYETPNTLGKDRLAAVCGAMRLYPRTDLLVIGIGTCITYDLVRSNGDYMGGLISPGLDMRLKAMHKFTAKLPLVTRSTNVKLIGFDTTTALQAGGLWGMKAEISGMMEIFKYKYDAIKVILAGGGAEYYKKRLKKPIFAHPNLVLLGLNNLLSLNA
ncbi:MAG: type III pantothenate kinase [Saprospiraceae bacterium]|nr:type III pantothenate kinase [Saprospiraceae bacterium]